MTGRRSRRAVAPMEKNARRSPRLVVVRARTRRAGNRCGRPRRRRAERRRIRRSGWTDGRRRRRASIRRPPVYERRVSGKRAFTRPLPPRGLADRRPTHPARLHHRARRRIPDAPRGRLRRVLADVWARSVHGPARGRRARVRRQGKVVRLGTWSGTLRGRDDDWTLWWARGCRGPRRATSPAARRSCRLIERWQAELARAQARGQRWEPLPPGVAAPAGAPAPRGRGAARARASSAACARCSAPASRERSAPI